MKLHVKKVYYKNIRKGKPPCSYSAVQPKGKGTDVYATIKLDLECTPMAGQNRLGQPGGVPPS